jgi:hypothetical protein
VRVNYRVPEFIVTTQHGPVKELTMPQLYNFYTFNQQVALQTGRLFAPMRQSDWLVTLSAAMAEHVEVDPPPDLQAGAEFLELLTEFLTNRTKGERREDLLAGRPWEDAGGDDDAPQRLAMSVAGRCTGS